MQGKFTTRPPLKSSPGKPNPEHDQTKEPEIQPIPVKDGLVFLRGWGLKVYVKDRHLVCEDGICEDRRISRFNRATSGLRRLVIVGRDGYVTFGALSWLHSIGTAFIQMNTNGEVILSSAPPGCDYPNLRRAQSLAAITDVGLSITRALLAAKIENQSRIFPDIAPITKRLEPAADLPQLRIVEAIAAAAYWQAWQNIPIHFARKDISKIPEHWKTFGARSSHVANGPRNATTPGNAMLNYLYAILEAETRIALLTYGLDPGIGILHTDQPSVEGLTHDVMEPGRPAVDAWLRDYISKQVFTGKDFSELEDGRVRMSLFVRQQLSSTAPLWAKAIAPWVERVVKMLSDKKMPTLLSQQNRQDGRLAYRMRELADKTISIATARCYECGVVLEDRERKYCDDCLPQVNQEAGIRLSKAGPATLTKMREDGADPAHGGDAGQKRSSSQARRNAERRAWERSNADVDLEREKERFAREILPQLGTLTLGTIQAATHCSPPYASLIRRGLYIPHPMHYDALGKLASLKEDCE